MTTGFDCLIRIAGLDVEVKGGVMMFADARRCPASTSC